MKVLLVLVATGVLAHPAPQHKLSGKAYVGLSQALGGRIPVGIYSAKRIFHGYETHDNDVVYLNLPGLSSAVGGGLAGDAGALGGGALGGDALEGDALEGDALGGGALGGGALGGGALGGAVGKKGEALGSLVGGGLSHATGALGAAVGGGAVASGDALGSAIGTGLATGASGLGGGAFDAGDALGAVVGGGLSQGVGALAASFGGTGALAEQLGEGAGAALGSLSSTLFRSKRQDSEQSNANQLSFALSGLGTLFVRRK